MKSILILAFLATSAFAQVKRSYDGYKVIRTDHLSKTNADLLQNLQLEQDLDFWQDPRIGRPSDIMVSPARLQDLEEFLNSHGIQFSVMIEDVEKLHQSNQVKQPRTSSGFDWTDYHSHDDINTFIDELAASNAGWVSTASIGKSYEGRDIRVVKIEKAGPGAPIAWIDANIHAREWITSATATFMINELVNKYEENKNIVDNLNIHFLPMANPDGYEYSRSSDRYWRKNRAENHGSSCKGVDLNRNFGFHWGESGVSTSPCSDIYLGSAPFSEVETTIMKNYVEGLPKIPALGLSIHSYSQLWLWPYGYDYSSRPDNWQEIKQLAEDAADALYAVHGTVFDPINSADLYPAAGASDDWYKGSLGCRYAFTTELRDTGYYGFELPASQIIESGEELFAGMKVVFNKIIEDEKQP